MDCMHILDHGYLKYVEHWGSDERIIEAARMSTGKGFLGWDPGACPSCNGIGTVWDRGRIECHDCAGKGTIPGDLGLLRRLWVKKHATPFEMAGLVVEVAAPIMVFREWHRHRTQCLAGDTLIHFEMPKSVRKGYHTVFKQKIKDLWLKWQPTVRNDRPQRQTNPLWPRSRIQSMLLRTLDEGVAEFTTSNITDVIRGEPKEMVRITVESGRTLTATLSHRVFTSEGWKTIEQAAQEGVGLALEGTARNKITSWVPEESQLPERWAAVLRWEGIYEVSTHGRVKRVVGGRGAVVGQIKSPTVGAQGYPVVGLTHLGRNEARTVHTLVLESFVGPRSLGQEARHKNHNRLDCRLENLEWGTSEDNSSDMVADDRCQRLVAVFEEITSVEQLGEQPTYDLAVCAPWHNFVADGFVVHNSYNEMSARYTPLPDVNYVPTVERLLLNQGTRNRQAGTVEGAAVLDAAGAEEYRRELSNIWADQEAFYQRWLTRGVPKELARAHLGVGRYSCMRASANLRNWLGFLVLRMAPDAQWEIRQFANALGTVIAERFPRTWSLFVEGRTDA